MRSRRVVYLVDDDAAVRNALGGLLAVCGFDVECFASGEEFLEEAADLAPGCVLLDLQMPGMSGLELQAALNRRAIHFPVAFLTAHGDLPAGVQAMKRGAIDFLEKPVHEAALLAVLENGFRRLGSRTEEIEAARQGRECIDTLTPREREVMNLVVQGRRNKEIAQQLSISVQTVKVHRMRGMSKMGVSTIPDLTRLWASATEPH